ncbi:MAG: efflux RND transporter permease subunit [Bacteriovoracaceae bacterium]
MLDLIIRFSLKNRLTVLVLSLILLVYGAFVTVSLPIDVFPDLNRPVVTLITNVPGMAPDEVETLITIPLETNINGTPGLTRVRSLSWIGVSLIYAEFEWGTDIYKNRQLIAEKIQQTTDRLPKGVIPLMAPASSIMGEIMFVGLVSPTKKVSPMELRTIADWVVRPRLMTITGLSQIVPIGGEVKQYQILVDSKKLQSKNITLENLKHSLEEISENTTGGFLNKEGKEFLIRPLGRVQSLEDIENSFVGLHLGLPVLVKDIATVKIGPQVIRGQGSINGNDAVILTIQKQPGTDTTKLTVLIEEELKSIQKMLPEGAEIKSDLFKQSKFIENSISNVEEALRDGAIMVAIILILFLLNVRTTVITLTAIPMSFVITAIVFKWLGLSVNTMTLGGLAVAIGELVDDAIVDVENVFRRLKENKQSNNPENPFVVIYKASSEVRNSIVFSTIIVVLVFIPLFAMSGIEGRLFAPLGLAYIISLIASLIVSLTVTPALCSYLLPNAKAVEHSDGKLVQWLKKIVEKTVRHNLKKPFPIIIICTLLFLASVSAIPFMGRNFLPEFNEGTAVVGVASLPGISLEESNELGLKIERKLMEIPEVKSVVRRVGRAELSEYVEGSDWNEYDIDFKEGREKEAVLNDIRKTIKSIAPEVAVNVGQPISHRLDHLLSGVRAQIALKIFGPDLTELRRIAFEMKEELEPVKGLVDLQVEPLVLIPQVKVAIDREASSQKRLSAGELANNMALMLNGSAIGRFIEGQRSFDIFVRLDDESRNTISGIENTLVETLPTGEKVKVSDVAQVYEGQGPNLINREDMIRRIIISGNSDGRDLESLVNEIKTKISKVELPNGYFVKIGGQFESQQAASKLIIVLGIFSLLGVFFVLFVHFKSAFLSLQVMLNIPLALIGSVIAIYLTEKTLSLATMVAFITLCGIASRNGIMMISHYLHLMKEEGETFSEEMIVRGTLERLVPVLMTALSAALALVPLLMSRGEPGKEILYPVAVVIVGGLFSSTLLDIFITPIVFFRYGKKSTENYLKEDETQNLGETK